MKITIILAKHSHRKENNQTQKIDLHVSFLICLFGLPYSTIHVPRFGPQICKITTFYLFFNN